MASPVPEELQPFQRDSISNGNLREQAHVRKWWYEEHRARGLLVWEYQLEGRFLDAVWFPDVDESAHEEPGLNTSARLPIRDREIILLEAKHTLNPELVGQALVYRELARRAGATVLAVYAFAERADAPMLEVAASLGVSAVILGQHPA